MNILKQSTAATVKLGAFVDDTDGKTAETGLTISQADIRLSKNGGDFAQTNNATGATHDEFGYYDIPLDTTDTGTLGRLRVAVHESGALPVWQDFLVVTANVYDTLCSTDNLDVNVTALAADVITASVFDESTAYPLKSADTGATQVARVGADSDTLETLSDQLDGVPTVAEFEARTKVAGDYFDHTIDTVTLGDDAITSNQLEETAVAKIQSGLALEATLTAMKGAGWTDETLVKIVSDIAAISAGSGATAQEVWEYATRVLTAGTNIDLSALATAANLAILDGKVDTADAVADAIKLKTDLIPASPAEAGEYTAAIAALQTDLDNPDQFKADVSALATTAHVQEVEDKVDAIPVDTTVIAGQVWSYPSRSLTVSSVRPRTLVDGDQFTIYKDTSITIPFTGLGDISGYTNLWFTIKREQDLESADTQSIVHMDYLTGLLYINKAAATAGHGSVTLDDPALGNITVAITKDGGALLPVFAKEPLRWEVKGVAGAAVDILLRGTCYIQPAVSRKIT